MRATSHSICRDLVFFARISRQNEVPGEDWRTRDVSLRKESLKTDFKNRPYSFNIKTLVSRLCENLVEIRVPLV